VVVPHGTCGGRSKFLHNFSHKTLNERAAGKPDVHMLGQYWNWDQKNRVWWGLHWTGSCRES